MQRRISNFAFKTFPIAQHHEFWFIQKDENALRLNNQDAEYYSNEYKNNVHVASRGNRNIIWSCLLFWIFYSHIFWFNALSISKIKDLVEVTCLISGRIFKSSAEVFSLKNNQNIIEWKPLPFCHFNKIDAKSVFK